MPKHGSLAAHPIVRKLTSLGICVYAIYILEAGLTGGSVRVGRGSGVLLEGQDAVIHGLFVALVGLGVLLLPPDRESFMAQARKHKEPVLLYLAVLLGLTAVVLIRICRLCFS